MEDRSSCQSLRFALSRRLGESFSRVSGPGTASALQNGSSAAAVDNHQRSCASSQVHGILDCWNCVFFFVDLFVQVCAVLRGLDFKRRPGLFLDFLALQEKLHANICRKRKLVSIGTHDLSKIQGPFTYTAEDPRNIKFVPLQRNWMDDSVRGKSMDAVELFALLRSVNDPCASYLHLIESAPKWPVLRDARGEVKIGKDRKKARSEDKNFSGAFSSSNFERALQQHERRHS